MSKQQSRSESPNEQPQPRVLTQELNQANRTGHITAVDIDKENGLITSEESNIIIEGEHAGQTHESEASNRISSFNRLYYDGLQQIISRQRAADSQEMSREQIEASQIQDRPIISVVSDAVAKSMPQRPKKAQQFQLYSTEWLKIRDAKVQQAREDRLNHERNQSTPNINRTSKYLPKDYQGPVRGYYEQVGKYFERKLKEKVEAKTKLTTNPRINRQVSKEKQKERDHDRSESVEARLIRKGEEYKIKKVQKRHQIITDEIQKGPQYQPQLVSQNDKYLPDNGQSRHARLQAEVGVSSDLPENLSPHQLLYYDALVGMVNKQKKIMEAKQEITRAGGQPLICEKSRKMAAERKLEDLMVQKPKHNFKGHHEKAQSPTESEKKANQATVQEFVERNYEKQIKKRAQWEQKVQFDKLKEEQLIKETARPKLSEGTYNMTADRKRMPTFEELYKAAKSIQQKKEARELRWREELKAKEQNEAPFEPELIHKSQDKQLKMIQSLNNVPKYDYGPMKKAQTTYSERYAKTREFKDQPSYQPLERKGFQPFKTNPNVGRGLGPNEVPFGQQYASEGIHEHMSALADTVLDEENNVLLMGSFPNTAGSTFGNKSQKNLLDKNGKAKKFNQTTKIEQSPDSELIYGFLNEMSSSQAVTKPLEKVIREAKLAIQEYDDQAQGEELAHALSQEKVSAETKSLSDNSASGKFSKGIGLVTPPPHSIKTPDVSIIEGSQGTGDKPRSKLQQIGGARGANNEHQKLQLIEADYSLEQNDIKFINSSRGDLGMQQDTAIMETFGSEKKPIPKYQRLNQEAAGSEQLDESHGDQTFGINTRPKQSEVQTPEIASRQEPLNHSMQPHVLKLESNDSINQLVPAAPENEVEKGAYVLDDDAELHQARFQRLLYQEDNQEKRENSAGQSREMPFQISREPQMVSEDAYNDQPRAASDQVLSNQQALESTPQQDFRVNRTLSQIEEEDEDAYSHNLTASQIQQSLTPGLNAMNKSIGDVSPGYKNNSPNISSDEIMSASGLQIKPRNSLTENFTSPNGPQIIIKDSQAPKIVEEIQDMEKEFTKFLEQIYN